MRDWPSESDRKASRSIRLEFTLTALVVGAGYLALVYLALS